MREQYGIGLVLDVPGIDSLLFMRAPYLAIKSSGPIGRENSDV